jgi:hypothetical protein
MSSLSISLLLCTGKCNEVRLFLRKSRAGDLSGNHGGPLRSHGCTKESTILLKYRFNFGCPATGVNKDQHP